MTRTFLLDGTALAYRAHFAFTGRGDGLTTSAGHPTSATFGFTTTLHSLLREESPDRIAVAFDGPREALERTKVYPEYKATRDKAPEELILQFPDIREVVEAHGIPILEMEGQEADDVIGTLAMRCKEAGDEVLIVTGDKDFMQLIDDGKVRLLDIMGRREEGFRLIGPEEVREKFGVRPDQIIDFLALMGDSSDNIPGVRGIGKKTASALLAEFGSLDGIYENLESIKRPAQRRALEEHREEAYLSRDLVRIRIDLDLPLSPEEIRVAPPDPERLEALFLRLEFRGLAERILAGLRTPEPRDSSRENAYRVLTTLEACKEFAASLAEAGRFAFDTETTSLDVGSLEVVGMSFAIEEGKAAYVPLKGFDLPEGHDPKAWLEPFVPILEDPGIEKVGQNAKYDIEAMSRAGVRVRGVVFDTLLASYCVAPGIRRHNLDELALRYFDHRKIPTSDLLGTGRKARTMDQCPVAEVGTYACEDADYTLRLVEPLSREMKELEVESVFRDIEMPLLPVLVDMEMRGIKVDSPYLEALSSEFAERIEELTRRIHGIAGEEFNIQSPQKLGVVLFEKLEVHKECGLRKLRRTRTGQYATDASVLESISDHPIGALLLEHRKLTKLKGTYVDTLPRLVRSETGRIHTSFNQGVAATGRLSSDNPNLQNIPIRTEEGRKIRKAFIPGGTDGILLSADYSQVELRILAHMSGDENLRRGFSEGEDVHRRTAAIVFGVLPELVTPEMRSHAKAVNYGLVYGMGPARLAATTGMSRNEAKKFIEAYFRAMPKVREWIDRTLETARRTGEVRTLFGRRRPLPDIDSKLDRVRVNAENVALNSPIQGTAADIIKMAMIRLHRTLREEGLDAHLLLQVHDELVVECPRKDGDRVAGILKDCMEKVVELSVPLEVEIGRGRNWLEAHP